MGPKTLHFAAVALTASALLLGAAPAVANNDPHRVFQPAPPFDLPPGVCTFGVHVEAPVDNEYSTITTASDGSTIVKTTGRFVVRFTNKDTGKSITLNASGPLTVRTPPGFPTPPATVETVHMNGLSVVYVTNGSQFVSDFGLPLPNLMYTSGPFDFTVPGPFTLGSVTRPPHVLLDVCAAMS